VLSRRVHKLDRKYYQDGENAFEMHCTLNREVVGLPALTDVSDALKRPEGGYLGVKLPEGAEAASASAAATTEVSASGAGSA
jgi:hypothetical protein